MNRKFIVTALLLGLAVLAGLQTAAAQVKIKDLPPTYRKWLEEEVVYIISPKEKAVFLQLSNDRERDLFIEAFWKARNPDPSSPTNPVKDEHYRRIQYANLWFGRGLKAGGWRSDMGRIYIILGEPKTIDRFENERDVYPIIIWFYEGLDNLGLPNAFNVVFFKKNGGGDYELYSPVRDGPQQLLTFYNGDMTNYQTAYQELLSRQQYEIADVSLTLIPNEYVMGITPPLTSDILIGQQIPRAAYEQVQSAYAEKLLKYRDIIEVEYTANYISSEALVKVFRDASGQAFVHYLIEPSKLSLEESQGSYRTVLNVNGIISDSKGNTVYQFDRELPVEFNSNQFAKIKDRLFSFQDTFPLIEGNYKLSILWKNTLSKEFTSVEASLVVPPAPSLTMSSPLLANRVVRSPELAKTSKPFTVAGMQLLASPRNDFATQDTMSVYCELDGLTEALRQNGSLALTITREGKEVRSVVKALRDYADPAHIVEEFPLADLAPAYYEVQTALLDGNKTEVISDRSPFYITPKPAVPRAWIMYPTQPAPGDPQFSAILAMQYLGAQDLGKAKTIMEQAYQKRPASPELALDYCRVLFASKDMEGVMRVAQPFYKLQKYEFAQFLGEAAQALGRYGEAVGYYKDFLVSQGTNINVLNAIGECYVKIGDIPQALTAWKKSLELAPKQDGLRAKIAELEKKVPVRK